MTFSSGNQYFKIPTKILKLVPVCRNSLCILSRKHSSVGTHSVQWAQQPGGYWTGHVTSGCSAGPWPLKPLSWLCSHCCISIERIVVCPMTEWFSSLVMHSVISPSQVPLATASLRYFVVARANKPMHYPIRIETILSLSIGIWLILFTSMNFLLVLSCCLFSFFLLF